MPAEPAGRERRVRRAGLVAALITAVVAVGAIGFLIARFAFDDGAGREALRDVDPTSGNPPRVEIAPVSPGGRVRASDPVDVVLDALGSAAIARYELWADGALVAAQVPSEDGLPPTGRMTWLPGTAGTHVLVARAVAEGDVATSRAVVVEALAGPDDGMVGVTVAVGQGATIESIASGLGVSPDMVRTPRPGVEPQPGEQVVVMFPQGQEPDGYVDDDGDRPSAGPEPEPEPEPEGGRVGDAEAAENAAPDELPWGFDRIGDPDPPTAPERLSVSLGEGCEVRLEWTDSSDSETGFRIYRLGAGGDFRPIRDVQANDAVAALAYVDHVWLGGHYEYYVASANAGGESPGPLAGIDVPGEQCAITVPPVSVDATAVLQIEFTSLATETSYDDAYCYVSVARLEPYARIPGWNFPSDEDVFLAPTAGGGWNIERYAAGINRLVFMQPPREAVPVRMECWARRGDEEPRLVGSFEASHPSEEWDGRALFAAPEGFRVAYHIERYRPDARALFSVEDSRIPAPSWVRQPDDPDECEEYADFEGGLGLDGPLALWACREIPPEELIIWEWEESPAFPRDEIDEFRVFVNREYDTAGPGGGTWQTLGEVGSVNQMFPIVGPIPSCGDTYAFRVTAVVRSDIPGAEERESPPSAPFVYNRIRSGPPCQPITVEITLSTLKVSDIDDGVGLECCCWDLLCAPWPDYELEAYGVGGFNVWHSENYATDYGQNFFFWTHDCGGEGEAMGQACLGYSPHKVESGTIFFAGESLMVCESYGSCTDFGPNHNTIRLQVQDGDRIEFWFNLRDDDTGWDGDDTWCGTDEDYTFESDIDESKPFSIGPYTYNEWDTLWGPFEWDNSGRALSDQDADCTLMVWVKTWTVGEDVD